MCSVAACTILAQISKKVDTDEVLLSAFPVRGNMWKHIQDSPALLLMIDYLKEKFIILYETHFKGKDKYAQFLISWHENLSHIAVAGCTRADYIWDHLVNGCENEGEATDRSAIISAVAKR